MSELPFAPQPSDEHNKLIEDLGGPKAVADEINKQLGTEITGQAVSNWKKRGIPFRYRGPLIVFAQKKEVETPSDFFGLSSAS